MPSLSDSHPVRDIIDLGAGDPNFPTPLIIVEAAIRVLREGHTHYIGRGGLPQLREAIADRAPGLHRRPHSVENVVITPGTKYAIYSTLGCLINPHDTVLILDPSWMSFAPIVELHGGIPVRIATHQHNDFFPDIDLLKARVRSDTKAMIINSPNNPTGRVYTREELTTLLEFAAANNLYVISDEIYSDMDFHTPHVSVFDIEADAPHLVVVNGFSKAYAMTGWRIGYVLGEKHLMERVSHFQDHTVTCANSIAQHTLSRLFATGQLDEAASAVSKEYRRRRDTLEYGLQALDSLELCKMEGGLYAWVRVSDVSPNSDEFALKLEVEHGVNVVPGSMFGEAGDQYVRICYARANVDKLEEAMERLRRFLGNIEYASAR